MLPKPFVSHFLSPFSSIFPSFLDEIWDRSVGGLDYLAINIESDEDNITVTALIPGVDPADIDISTAGNTLTIKGMRKFNNINSKTSHSHRQEYGEARFLRSVYLPFDIEEDKIKASSKNGVLKLVMPKSKSNKTKKIPIKVE